MNGPVYYLKTCERALLSGLFALLRWEVHSLFLSLVPGCIHVGDFTQDTTERIASGASIFFFFLSLSVFILEVAFTALFSHVFCIVRADVVSRRR